MTVIAILNPKRQKYNCIPSTISYLCTYFGQNNFLQFLTNLSQIHCCCAQSQVRKAGDRPDNVNCECVVIFSEVYTDDDSISAIFECTV